MVLSRQRRSRSIQSSSSTTLQTFVDGIVRGVGSWFSATTTSTQSTWQHVVAPKPQQRTTIAAEAESTEPTLAQIAKELKEQLGIEGNIADIINGAVKQLGVTNQVAGLPLNGKAKVCWRQLNEGSQAVPQAVPRSKRTLWEELADGVHTQDLVRKLFRERQNTGEGCKFGLEIDGDPLKVEHFRQLEEYRAACTSWFAGGLPPPPMLDWQQAQQSGAGTFLFHGAPYHVGCNIMHEGLVVPDKPSHGALLGKGIYGAPSPQKAYTYTTAGNNMNWHFLFVCRFNLNNAKHGNSNNGHEFCAPDPRKVVVLWQVKVKQIKRQWV